MQRPSLLVELLIGGAIVAVVVVISAYSIQDARSRLRDAVRLSGVRQTISVLDQVFQHTSSYPAGEALPLGDISATRCLSTQGFSAECPAQDSFLDPVPATIDVGLEGLSACGVPKHNAFCYTQTNGGQGYAIEFELERSVTYTDLAPGLNCATPEGIKPGSC